jgi:putative ATPase
MIDQAMQDPRGLNDPSLRFAPGPRRRWRKRWTGTAQVSELSGAPGRHGRGRQLRGAGDRQYLLAAVVGEHVARFDKGGDHFYDLISAVHKSIAARHRMRPSTGMPAW